MSRISVIVDTGNKFITGVVDTAEQLSLVTTKPAINLLPVSMTLVNNDRRVTKTPVITFSLVSTTGEQLSSVITTLVINLSPVSTIPVNKKVSETLTLANNLSPVSLVHWCR